MSGNASDRVRMRARPAPLSRPAATPRRDSASGAPVAGAPGWYVVRRRSPISVLFDRVLRRRPRFELVAVATAAGGAVLVLALSLVRGYWVEPPAERSTTGLKPPVHSSQGARPHGSPAASAEAPVVGLTSEPDATMERARGLQGGSAPETSRAQADPAPPEEVAGLLRATRQAQEALAADRQRRSRPLASAPSSLGDTPSARLAGIGSQQPPPQAADRPARLASMGKPEVAGEDPASENRPTVSAGEIRVFIHHVAEHREGMALAQQLADHLRTQGFTVADIRPVAFSIGMPSVRYFFEHDRSASERLVDELGRFLAQTAAPAPDQASDFTHFAPKPRPGNVEVWLPAS